MQTSKPIKISMTIWAIGILIAMVIYLSSMIKPMFMKGIFENYMGKSWSQLVEQQPRQATLYNHLSRINGCYYLMGCIYVLFILFTSYRERKKWAWVVLLIATALDFGVLVGFGVAFSDPAGVIMGIVSLCIGLIALLIPAKDFWKHTLPVSTEEI